MRAKCSHRCFLASSCRSDPSGTLAIMPVQVSRRSVLAGAAAAVTVATIAACTKQRATAPERPLIVGNHPLYIDGATNRRFEAASHIPVEYHEDITDDAGWLVGVTPRLARHESIDRDVVIVSDWAAHRLVDGGWLEAPPFCIWAKGMTGIAYNATVTEPRRLADLFQPPLHDRVALPSDMRLALGTALLADRVNPQTVTVAQASETATRLANSISLHQIKPFDSSRPIDRLVAGDVDAAIVRASDTVGLEREHNDIRFVVPEEGGLLLSDMAVVPVNGPNPDAARRYLAYVDDPEHAVDRFRVLPVLWPQGPLDERLRTVAPDAVADPRRNPPPEVRARLRSFRFLTEADDDAFTAVFERVVHANR